MDIDESQIGVWPNVALEPGTWRHAATGEPVRPPHDGPARPIDGCGLGSGKATDVWLGGVRHARREDA